MAARILQPYAMAGTHPVEVERPRQGTVDILTGRHHLADATWTPSWLRCQQPGTIRRQQFLQRQQTHVSQEARPSQLASLFAKQLGILAQTVDGAGMPDEESGVLQLADRHVVRGEHRSDQPPWIDRVRPGKTNQVGQLSFDLARLRPLGRRPVQATTLRNRKVQGFQFGEGLGITGPHGNLLPGRVPGCARLPFFLESFSYWAPLDHRSPSAYHRQAAS